MALTGNTYGSKVARVGVVALVAHYDQTGAWPAAVLTYDARITGILGDGSPLVSVAAPMPMCGAFEFVACASQAQIDALTPGQWTWPLTARSLIGAKGSPASADVTAAADAGWTSMHSDTYTSVGGTSLSVFWTIAADVAVAGQARIIVSGGAYGAGTQIGQVLSFDALAAASVSSFTPASLAIAAAPGTVYTITIQARALGGGSSVVMAAGSAPTTNGARLSFLEYH